VPARRTGFLILANGREQAEGKAKASTARWYSHQQSWQAGPGVFRQYGLKSPIYAAGACAPASLTPGGPNSANGCCFLSGVSLRPFVTGSAATLDFSRLQSSLRADFALMFRPVSWLALRWRTLPFELSLAGSPELTSNMTSWVFGQCPRPDFHRQVQWHCGLRKMSVAAKPPLFTQTTKPPNQPTPEPPAEVIAGTLLPALLCLQRLLHRMPDRPQLLDLPWAGVR
jgi:hypothetical protein